MVDSWSKKTTVQDPINEELRKAARPLTVTGPHVASDRLRAWVRTSLGAERHQNAGHGGPRGPASVPDGGTIDPPLARELLTLHAQQEARAKKGRWTAGARGATVRRPRLAD